MPLLCTLALALAAAAPTQLPDRDGDGLPDAWEVHKYGTDPARADSDGDGTPDGDWLERREYAYTIHAVVEVLGPVTPAYLCDDFQDARLLDRCETHATLEVVLYPYSTMQAELPSTRDWHDPPTELAPWLAPGPTADWTPELRAALLAALAADGIRPAELDDRAFVERASTWLCAHARSEPGFTVYFTSFDAAGRPYLAPEFAAKAAERARERGHGYAEHWPRELSAAGMFANRVRGSCSSSSIYLSGCLRALGIPTRTVRVIPLVDASDPRERALLDGLVNLRVRDVARRAARAHQDGWTSHTYNEVWVGGRWLRLDYDRLGQGILVDDALGVRIHTATLRDWADGDVARTLGRRQDLGRYDDRFGGPNPYSTLSLRDAFGVHGERDNPPPAARRVEVASLRWTDDPSLPADVREGCARHGRFGLVALVTDAERGAWWKDFLAHADLAVELRAPGHAPVATELNPGCWWGRPEGVLVWLPLDAEDRAALVAGAEYAATASNGVEGYEIGLALTVTR